MKSSKKSQNIVSKVSSKIYAKDLAFRSAFAGLLLMAVFLIFTPILYAQTLTSGDTNVNIGDSNFSLIVCDGPVLPPNFPPPQPNYRPCDFNAVMRQVQHLINIAMVVGTVGALVSFLWAGYLYITGVPANISQAHKIFPNVFWGFIIMLTAWFIVYQLLSWLVDGSGYTKLLGS